MKKYKSIRYVVLWALVIMLMSSVSVLAANGQSVSATISASQSSATSNAIWNCQDWLELHGSNYRGSTNSLYVQCYEQRNSAVDLKKREMLLPANTYGSNTKWKLSSSDQGSNNYVKLNPKGALAKGCNGKGTLYD